MKHQELPAKPAGWGQKMEIHIACSDAGGRFGVYIWDIFDADGERTPISRCSSTSKLNGSNYYAVKGTEEEFTSWAQLREAWPRLKFLAYAKATPEVPVQ